MRKGKRKDYEAIVQILNEEDTEREKVQRDLEEQIKKESENPCEFRHLEQIMASRRGGAYKSGKVDGKQIMTYDDYTRLIVNESRISQYGKGQGVCEPDFIRPATVYQVRASGKKLTDDGVDTSVETVIASNGLVLSHTEMSDTTRFGAVKRFIDEWFPAVPIAKPSFAARRRMASASAGIAWVLIFVLVLALPLTISTMKLGMVSTLNDNRETLKQLKAQEARLEADYETSIDLLEIDTIARLEFGMVDTTEATVNLLILNPDDQIETFDDENVTGVLPALLSALGIRAPQK